MAKAAGKAKGGSLDLATAGGLLLGLGGILGGLIMEGGNMKDVSQVTAAIIVLGGTLGAVMVTTPMPVLLRAAKQSRRLIWDSASPPGVVIENLIELATKARRGGIVSLEQDAETLSDPFLKKALSLAVDGTDLEELRKIMELEISVGEHEAEAEAKVYEAAGGYAPTIGIIGAVMGLIQVMKNLANIDEVGHGIAVAFVATVYGVGTANLLFLPAANKLKARARVAGQAREMMLEGVLAIAEGMNPKLIRSKLEAYLQGHDSRPKPGKAPEKAAPAGARS